MKMDDRYDVIVFWRQNEFVASGRRAESLARWMSVRPDVRRVFYLEPPMDRRRFDAASRWRKLLPLHVIRETPSFWRVQTIRPNTILGLYGDAAERWGRRFTLARLKRLIDRHSPAGRRVLWVYPPHPFAIHLTQRLAHERLVSDLVDDVDALAQKTGQSADVEALVRRSDAVFATSADLERRLIAWNPGIRYVPNGLEPDFIANEQIVPPRPAGRRPVIGYVGVFSGRTNPVLLRRVAQEFRDCDLELVGWVSGDNEDLQALFREPNVIFRGRIPFDRVAATIDGFDVCLLPHRDTVLSRSMSPLKLFQYLARGKPVVSTDVLGLELVRDQIHVARDDDEFVAMIRRCLADEAGDAALRASRLRAVRSQTWDTRVQEMWDSVLRPGGRALDRADRPGDDRPGDEIDAANERGVRSA